MPLLQTQHVTYKLLSPQRNIQPDMQLICLQLPQLQWYVVFAMAARFPLQRNTSIGLLLSQEICVPNMKHVYFQTAK